MRKDNEERKLLEYLTPFFGLYACIRDRNTPSLREDITTTLGTESRFSAMMLGQVPLNLIEAI